MRTVYIADDGKQFDDKYECKDYEWKLKHPCLNSVIFYDVKGNRMSDISSQDTYELVMKIIVPSDEAAKALQELGDYTGFYSYEHINESGVWVWKDYIFVKE